MTDLPSIVDRVIVRLWQTPSRPVGVWIEEFGEAFWIELVAELDDGQRVQINEYDWSHFAGSVESLIPAELVQADYSLSQIEGQRIVEVVDIAGEFAVVLENGLCFKCDSAPGGNFPWIYTVRDLLEDGEY